MKNLAFYADGSTGCLLAMFGAVADMTVENARAEWDEKGVASFTWLFENVTKDERQKRMKRHLAHMKPQTRALLSEARKRGANVHAEDDDATH